MSNDWSLAEKKADDFENVFLEEEDHVKEQYFFTDQCIDRLLHVLDYFQNPCCLCTPSLALRWFQRNRVVTTLDIDERFSFLPGFQLFDLTKPIPLTKQFDVIVCDPPFFQVPISTVFQSIKQLAKGDYSTKLLIVFVQREEKELLKTFSPFGLLPTNFHPGYRQVKPEKWENYRLYSNWDAQGMKRIKKHNK